MNYELSTIRTKGKKEVPRGTKIELRLGSLPGTVSVKVQLPGQKNSTEFGDLKIVDEAIELPVNLAFLSHAKEDVEIVASLCERLLHDGVLTWFDDKDLLPGDDWKLKINKGIDSSDYVLVFLSQKSVNKEGYFQKELKTVIERYELMPEGSRYIIPILINDCTPPRKFKDIHWLSMNSEGWYPKLLKALNEN